MRTTSMLRIAGLIGVLGLLVSFGGVATPPTVEAQAPKAEFKLKLMGINRTLDPWKLYEEWARTVEKRTNGRVQFELTSLPELGFGGAETIRVIKTGVVDVAEIYGGYVAGELPMVEILEMPGIFPDPQVAKKAVLAWKPHETKILDQKANAVLLAMALYPDQAFFSKRAVRKPADFKGLKSRVHSVALASLVAGLGGEPLTVPFAETYTALERGTLDAGITGTKPGFGLRWYEVSKYLVGPISMRPHVALSINKTSWRRLPADIQQILKEEAVKIVEGKAFEAIEVWNKEGIDKNVEKGMEHIPFSPETLAVIKDLLRTKVVPDWVKRAGGAEAAKNFNEVIAPLVGFTVTP
jgi:TRAP-type C4-dicarboxylate transport system substrate-binding protein